MGHPEIEVAVPDPPPTLKEVDTKPEAKAESNRSAGEER